MREERTDALPMTAWGALLVTNAIKLGGLGIAINEALLRADLRPVSLAVAAFMMAGAQGIESFLDKFLAR